MLVIAAGCRQFSIGPSGIEHERFDDECFVRVGKGRGSADKASTDMASLACPAVSSIREIIAVTKGWDRHNCLT